MSARFVLDTVLRVRRVREELARAEAAAANAATHRAASEHARREAALAGRPEPGTDQAAQWLASRATALTMASDVAAAREVVATRRAQASAAMNGYVTAQRERDGVEDLADRHLAEQRQEREAAEGRERDDRAATSAARRRTEGHDEPHPEGHGGWR